jgi:Ca2+-binding RTX toxin-like protein
MALKPGSPAIDAGSDALAVGPNGAPLTTDQRGAGFPRKQGPHVDIGAFEQPAAGTRLTLNGTAGNDSMVVTQVGASLKINVNGAITHRGAFEFAGITLNGSGGDDFLFLDKAITLPFTLNGGDGNDLMHPGAGAGNVIGGTGTDTADYSDNTAGVSVSADDVANDGPGHNQDVRSDVEMLLGGSGNDMLTGSTLAPNLLAGNGGNDVLHGLGNRDVLIGGTGRDQLFGDSADDLLIDSRTVYDGNVLFLRTLRFEWQNPANDYATRINRLKAGVLGVKISSANVPNDNAVDTLTGGTGRDWFVLHAGDAIADKAADETATQL